MFLKGSPFPSLDALLEFMSVVLCVKQIPGYDIESGLMWRRIPYEVRLSQGPLSSPVPPPTPNLSEQMERLAFL